jgi:histidinol dehydrogenase
MLRTLSPTDPQHAAQVDALCRRSVMTSASVEATAREIVEDVRRRGDAAVADHTLRLDRRRPEGGSFEVARARWEAEAARVPADVRASLERAVARVTRFHVHQRRHQQGYVLDEEGVRMELRVEPLARVGLYVPGGTALYPSSVVMTAVPARVAGVRDIIMVTPGASPETLLAARLAGVDRVFEIGGAQAVAALAYGTETVPRVDKIVGPGNAWVAAAKRLVFGDVDIDAIAGPSEVLVIADDAADARLVAADLLAQAEHDREAVPVLVTTSAALAARVDEELERQLATLPRRDIARAALENHGAAVLVADVAEAVRLANRFAPEHLELHVRDAARTAEKIRAAGAIFVGGFSPEAAGDYLCGPNHVLPTAGAARYASPLGVYHFVKMISVLEYTPEGLAAQAEDIVRLAGVEKLDAHARSVTMRVKQKGTP